MLPTCYIHHLSVQFLTMATLYGTVVEWVMPDCWIIFKEGHPELFQDLWIVTKL